MTNNLQPFAIVTGASSGIGYELAKLCAQQGFDLLIAADQPEITQVAQDLRATGVAVDAIQTDLATTAGVDKLYAAARVAPWMRCWPMPGMVWATASWIKTLARSAMSSTPTSPARST